MATNAERLRSERLRSEMAGVTAMAEQAQASRALEEEFDEETEVTNRQSASSAPVEAAQAAPVETAAQAADVGVDRAASRAGRYSDEEEAPVERDV